MRVHRWRRQLASTIENTQDVLELTLDNERNRIARLEVLLSMVGLCVGTCSAVSGFFGMNLLSGVENVPGLFLLVTGTSILLTGSLFVTWCVRATAAAAAATHAHDACGTAAHACGRRRRVRA